MRNTKDFYLSIISLIATIIGYFSLKSEFYAQIPTAFGFEFQQHNIVVGIIGVIVLTILWLIVVIFLWCLSMYFFLGMVMTPILFFSSVFSKSNRSRSTNLSSSSGSSYSNHKSTHRNKRNSYNKQQTKKRIVPGKRGTYIDPKTGKFNKRDNLDLIDMDAGQKVDLETGKFYEDTLLGYKETGKKIDFESGEIYKDTLLGYKKTGTRINQKTGEIEKEGLLGWTKTDERINPDTGKRQERDIFGGWFDKN